MSKSVSGFSKLSKLGKIHWLQENYFTEESDIEVELMGFDHEDPEIQKILDGFSENTIANFPMPFGLAPNFMLNGQMYCVPMVIEESSVVAAASSAAKYWLTRGGFHAEIIDTRKIGQLHFTWKGQPAIILSLFPELKKTLLEEIGHLTVNMEKRGGGVLDIELLDNTQLIDHYYQLRVSFETCDSMGANFINTILEEFGHILRNFMAEHPGLAVSEREVNLIMAILSNYTPDCLVRAWVECPVEALSKDHEEAVALAEKFRTAIEIARVDPYRATTHNKGIFNGIDAVVLATGNDFRAIEACGHTYAARDGQYRGLSRCTVENGIFKFWLDIPLAMGTVGGLTALHPLAKLSLEMLGKPTARELMMIVATTGLAQNFAAIRSLVTTGIQKGHMKMHLMNILRHLQATDAECDTAAIYFEEKTVSFSAVREFLDGQRKG